MEDFRFESIPRLKPVCGFVLVGAREGSQQLLGSGEAGASFVLLLNKLNRDE